MNLQVFDLSYWEAFAMWLELRISRSVAQCLALAMTYCLMKFLQRGAESPLERISLNDQRQGCSILILENSRVEIDAKLNGICFFSSLNVVWQGWVGI
jgi:hypothetical protein